MVKHKRSKQKQSIHDSAVKRVAAGFKGRGWNVRADVSGYSPPSTINHKRPDVMARKGKKVRVVEVETPGTYARDKGQRNAFRSWASRSSNRRFRTRMAR